MSSAINLLQPVYANEVYTDYSNNSNARVSSTDSSVLGYTENGTSIVTGTSTANTDMFLKLLVAQMSNLDPFGDNNDPTQYITQLAQFSTLEQMQSISSSIDSLYVVNNGLLVNSALTAASSFLGKNAEFLTSSESTDTVTGKVQSVYVEDGLVYLEVALESGEVKSFSYDTFVKVIAE